VARVPDYSEDLGSLTARIHVLTLGVSDLERATSFYRDGLGLPSPGITATEFGGDDKHPAGAIAMFTLDDGLRLALYPRSELAKDAGVDASHTAGSGLSIGHIVERREDVDRVLDLARRAGARVLGPAHDRPWGICSGYFSDPDDHLWEVIYILPRVPA
jgi:uncharacterized protein